MNRYIDADALGIGRANRDVFDNKAYADGWNSAIDIVVSAPTADVQEVRRGKMNMYKPRSMNRNATYKCSVCGKLCSSYYNDIGEWKFCPHCGANMDGAENERKQIYAR